MNTTRKEKSVPTVPDKNYSLKEIEAIIRRNDNQFAQIVFTYATVLEKSKSKKSRRD